MRGKVSVLSEIRRFRGIRSSSFCDSLSPSQPRTTIISPCIKRLFSSPPLSSRDSIRPKTQNSFFPIINSRRVTRHDQHFDSSGTLFFLSPVFHSGTLYRVDGVGFLPTESSRRENNIQFRRSSSDTRFCSCGPEKFAGIAESVLSRCLETKEEKEMQNFEGKCLAEILGRFYFLPDLIRRFRRAKILKPDDVLKILEGCLNECGTKRFEERIVDSAWSLFAWAPSQNQFRYYHLSQSYNAMLRMLIGGGLIEKVETLLLQMDAEGALVDWFNLSVLVEEYLKIGDIDKSFAVHDRAKRRGWLLNSSCYDSLIDGLIKANQARLAATLLVDLIEAGSKVGIKIIESVISGLCKDERFRDAEAILRKMVNLGYASHQSILEDISNGYAKEGDFEGLLNFFKEFRYVPKDNCLNNRIIFSQSKDLGSEKAFSLMQELANLGFAPDGKSFRIIICSSCREGRVKNAMKVLSELFLRQLKPDLFIYNAIISSIFKLGLSKHSKEIFYDMIERGLQPDISTFRVLLAGHCKERRFEEVKWVVHEMSNNGLISSFSSVDGVMVAFSVLGLDSRTVKVKRDNTLGLLKTEFYDALGNGLYLEADVDTYERALSAILEDATDPDLGLAILKECSKGDMETSLKLKDEMIQWGQQPSPSVYSVILKGLSAHRSTKAAADLLTEMPKQHLQQLSDDTLALAIRILIDQGKASEALLILEGMFARNLTVDNRTCSDLIVGLCKEETQREFFKSWELATQNGWIPSLADTSRILHCLFVLNMLREILELFEKMLMKYLESTAFICGLFIEELSHRPGFAKVCFMLFQQMLQRSFPIDDAIYGNIIKGLCEEKMILEAVQVLDDMLEKAHLLSFDVYTLIVPVLFKLEYSQKAINLGYMLLDKQVLPASTVYSSLINELSRMGKFWDASLLFQETMANGACPENFAFDAVLKGKCLEKNFNHVYEILCSMTKRGIFPSLQSYRNMLKLFSLEGKVKDALRLKDIFLAERKYSDVSVYALLIYQLFQADFIPTIQNLLLEMHEKGITIDPVAYNILVVGFSKSGDISNSLKYFEVMIKKNMRPSNRSFRVVITSLCNSQQINKALELMCEVEHKGWTPYSLAHHILVQALFRAGMVSKAVVCLNQMQDAGSLPQCASYNILIRECCKYQMLERAVDLLNIMLKKRNLPTASTYRALVLGFCERNLFDQALDFYTEMLHQDLEPGVNCSDAIIRGLCNDRRVGNAQEVLSGMLERGQIPSGVMYQYVVDSCFKSNEFKKASEVLNRMQQSGHRPNFSSHWSLIYNLASTDGKNNDSKGFLSRVLAESGFPFKETTG